MGTLYTIQFLLLVSIPIWILSIIFKVIVRKKRNIKINIKREIIDNLFYLYLILLIGVTIFPIFISDGEHFLSHMNLKERANIFLVPFIGYIKYDSSSIEIIGNFILLIPFIGYLYIVTEKITTIKKSLITSLLISIFIELIQMLLNIFLLVDVLRTVHIDDVILNTLGGVFIFCVCNLIYKKHPKILSIN